MTPRFMIAAPGGRSGKTIVSIGLCDIFRRRGLLVQPFKKGPDYIDASWLTAASQINCRNLDMFLMDETTLMQSFEEISENADIAIIEGNMGFYDGIDPEGKGSSAYLSRLLVTPVMFILNTARMSRSAAALINGFQSFEPETQIAGVILNNIAGERHKFKLVEAVERYCNIPVLGAIPRINNLNITERHLGLVPFNGSKSGTTIISDIGAFIERNIDADAIFSFAQNARDEAMEIEAPGFRSPILNSSFPILNSKVTRIGIIYDRVFNFYYPENIEALERAGAEIIYIDSLKDRALPEIDGLYIGGGFPELYLEELDCNKSFMKNVATAIEGGLTVYAECAGFMYLSRGIRVKGKLHAMAGVIPTYVEILKKPVGHGYVEARITRENPFFKQGTVIRGHEFHHSKPSDIRNIRTVMEIQRGYGIDGKADGMVYKNVFASYTHIHALGTPGWADSFVMCTLKNKRRFSNKNCIQSSC